MKQKIYWKDVGQALLSSKGRFLSIFSLMMLGAIALIGLKVTSPNMEKTAQAYLGKTQTMDLAVMSDMGLDEEDIAELETIEGAQVETGYFKDGTLDSDQQAVRVFSKPSTISLYQVQSGRLPTSDDEIALSPSLAKGYKIGDQVKLTEPDKNGTVLTKTSFTLVGIITSPEIWDNVTMGLASSGNGQLAGYALVEPTVFDSEVYMIARLSYDDLDDLAYYQDSYEAKVASYQKDLDQLLADNGQARLARIQAQGQDEIATGQEELDTAQTELTEVEAQLEKSRADIQSGQEQLENAHIQLREKEVELARSKYTLDQTKESLNQTKSRLETSHAELERSRAFLEASKAELDQAASELEQAKSILASKQTELDQWASKINQAQADWFQKQESLKQIISQTLDPSQSLADYPDLLDQQTRLDQVKAGIDQELQAYNQAQSDYQAARKLLQEKETKYQTGLQDYQTGLTHYQTGRSQYDEGLAQYQAGLAQYEASLAQYQAGQEQLTAGKNQLKVESAQISQAESQLAQAQTEFDQEKAEATSELSQAQRDLQQAQSELKSLEEPSYQTYTRSTLPGGDGYTTYKNATGSIAAVGNIFPVVLYLVAALVTFTTMTRFVDEERTRAGLFKALGYTDRQIMTKFVLYGLGAGLAGTLVGILAGNFILSPMISAIITESTVIGDAQLHFYPFWNLLALVFSLLSAVLPAYLVAHKELKEKPANLLLPKPPVQGSTILLERLPFIWNRLSFTHKVTARNIFRYKKRMFMTIFGVAGSVALLFGGLGIRSSISGVVDRQFGDIMQYDMIVVDNSRASEAEKKAVDDILTSQAVSSYLPIAYEQLTEEIDGLNQPLTVSLLVTEKMDLSDYIQLRQAESGEKLSLPNTGLILSKKLASLYGVTAGDSFSLTIDQQTVTVKVAGVSELYAGHFIYMTAAYYEEITGQAYQANASLVKVSQSSVSKSQDLAAQLLSQKGVAALVQNRSLIAMLETVASSLQSIMVILVVLSILLGLVILYNLTNINVAERIRELSTIKVLGFHNCEVTLYIYRETIVLSLIGVVLGLGGGILLHRVLLEMIGSNSIIFNPQVSLEVYLIPILAIVAILTGLGWYVNRSLRKVDMLEALKSVD
ncbi:TPA: FtsX-like permease family protein [Streptococcus suis]|nr:FtsX-like permease family protein [Streptococcus suis]HEL2058727.1 FtsX-like permease family protein [Streptococcus suis]